MRFANPQTGYTESRSTPLMGLCAFLFGGLYCLIAGLWAPAIVWFVIAIFLYAAMGPPATVLMIVVALIYSAVVPMLVRSSYLRRGWVELPDDDSPDAESVEFVKCPFCAETIRREAIKCKHCGSDVSRPNANQVVAGEPSETAPSVVRTRADRMPAK